MKITVTVVNFATVIVSPRMLSDRWAVAHTVAQKCLLLTIFVTLLGA